MNWVKLKKGHPRLGHFVGDVFEVSDERLADLKLYDQGYATPASKDEISAAKAALAAPSNRVPTLTLREQMAAQQQEIDRLRAELASKDLPPAPSDPPKK